MTELLQVFNSYNEIEHKAYFAFTYGSVPSELIFETPMKEEKKNIDAVLDLLFQNNTGFELLFKNWKVEAKQNISKEKDYPFQYFYEHQSSSCLLSISLNNENLTVGFLYDCKETEIENWILDTKYALQAAFGEEKTSVFKVLAKHSYGFDTEDVKTDDISVDTERNYNNDFEPVHACISDAIDSKGSGLILLHGSPGTGKTTYIKSLIAKYEETDFIFIQNEFVNNLLDPDFVSATKERLGTDN